MNKNIGKVSIVVGIIFIAILFSNIIYAGNSRADGIYVDKVIVENRNHIATNGDRINITVKSKEKIEFKESLIYIDGETISNADIEYKDNKEDDEYIISYQIPDEIKIDNDKTEFEGDNVSLSFAITVSDSDGTKKVLNCDEKNQITYYKKLADMDIKIEEKSDKENLKKGDMFAINIITTHPVDINDIKLKEMENEFKCETESDDTRMNWNVRFTLTSVTDDIEYTDDIVNIIYEIVLKDELDKYTKSYNSNLDYYRPIKPEVIQKTVDGEENKKVAKSGQVIFVKFIVSHYIKLEDIIPCGGKDIQVNYGENENEYTATYFVTDSENHNENMVLSLMLTDPAENVEVFKISDDVKYLKPFNDESVTNLKADKIAVKDGDKLTVTLKTDRYVNVENMEIIYDFKNQDASIKYMNAEPLKKEYGWKFEFRIRGKYFDKDDIKLFCNYTITDEAGDSYTGDNQCSVYYEPIDIKDFTINSNKENSKTFKNEDDITISFKTTHPVKAKCSIAEKLKNITITFSDVNRKNNKYEYTYTFNVKDGQFADNEEIKAKLIVNDAAKNAEEVISKESDIKYYAPIEETFKSLKCISSNDNAHYVIYKDSFTLIYESGHPVNIQNMVIAGKMVKCKSSKYGKKWEGTVKLKDLDLSDNSIIKYNFKVTDDAGNTPKSYNQKNYPSVIYFAPIEINDLKMVTGNNNRNLAKTGDKLTLSFTTTHKIDIRNFQIKLSEFQNAEIVKNGKWERGKYCYVASYTVPEDNKYDDKRIGMSIMVGDAAGNSIVSVSEKDTPDTILYYRPIKMAVSNTAFESSNNYSAAAKNGDTLKLSFESSHPVSVDGKIAGTPVKFNSSDGGYSWSGSVKAAENMLNDNSCIEYSMNICDDAGNEYSIDQKSTANIVYYAPLSVNGLSMESDNESGNIKIAKNNDNITIRFSTTHPVYISDSAIAGQKVDFISDDQMNWTAVYKVNDGDTDNMSAIAMNFIVNDLAGNTEVMVTQNGIDNVIYYAPVQVSDVKITTNNAKNANLYAKDGDTVTVEFSTNHQVHMINGMIAGQMADVSSFKVSDTDYRWQMNYTIKNGDISDSSNVGFEFSLDDEAHNNLSVNQDRVITQNAITYYAPFTADTEYSSDYKDGNYVKNGDTITVKCKATHPVSVVNALIAGRQALVQQNDSDEVLMIYTIPENEGAMPEGGISFEYTIEDKAGNELIINQISEQSVIKTIIYDRTLPQIKVTNDNTGGASFYSDTVKYSLEYTGTNIYEEGMSCVINGVESIGDFKREPIEDGYRIDIELNAEENYLIKASCIDMAGNKDSGDASIAVTVDKTSPKLKIVNINTGHIFNSEFTLADYLDIDESNLRDIDCMLTDSEGSKDWDINSEVTGDGKKTVTLKMTDMAGNVSDTYVYEFYVDVTAPSPVIMDKDSGYMFKQGKNTKRFAKNMSLNISLDEINVGKEPDKFTSIKVLDEDGNEYMDVIKSGIAEEDGSYSISIGKDGEYTLNVQAVDSVGNETGLCKYSFMVGEKPWYIRFYENTPVFVTVVVCMSLLTVMGAAGFVIKKKGK